MSAVNWQKSGSARFVLFHSLADMRDAVEATSPELRQRHTATWRESDTYGFTGAQSMAEAHAHSRGDGWNVESRTASMLEALEPYLARVERRRIEQRPAVAGAFPSVPRALSGDPRGMVALRRVQQVRPARSVRVLLNRGALGTVAAETLVRNGATVAALCEALRRSGLAVDLWVTNCATESEGGKRSVSVACHLGTSGTGSQDTAAAMFALAHPAFHRRYVFALREQANPERSGGQYFSCETPEPVAQAIGATLEVSLVALEAVRDHGAWIRQKLAESGVTLAG